MSAFFGGLRRRPSNWRSPDITQITQIRERLPELQQIKNIEFASIAEWATRSFQKRGIAFYGKLLTVIICCYFLADVLALLLGRYIPDSPTAGRGSLSTGRGFGKKSKTLEDYNVIAMRNLFNSQGIIPGEEFVPGGGDLGGPAVRTSLPFNLIGTLILRDEFRSIATIEDKSASMVYPVRASEEIPGKAKILKVEPDRVIFVNSSTGKREYVELPQDKTGNPRILLGSPQKKTGGGTGIEQVAPNQFNISKVEVDKAMSDLNNILTQARAVPNFENGVPAGYKLFQIVPGSIYDKLGLKNGDVISGMNGAPINDPGQAFQMLNELKNGKHLELQVKRDGKTTTNSYDIN